MEFGTGTRDGEFGPTDVMSNITTTYLTSPTYSPSWSQAATTLTLTPQQDQPPPQAQQQPQQQQPQQHQQLLMQQQQIEIQATFRKCREWADNRILSIVSIYLSSYLSLRRVNTF